MRLRRERAPARHIDTMSLFGSDDLGLPPPAAVARRRGDTDTARPMPPRKKSPEEKQAPPKILPPVVVVDPRVLRKGQGEPAKGPGSAFKTFRVVRYIAGLPYGASIDVPLDWLDPSLPKTKENQTAFFSEMTKIASIHLRYREAYFQFQWKSMHMPEPAVADMADMVSNAATWEAYCRYLKEEPSAAIFI